MHKQSAVWVLATGVISSRRGNVSPEEMPARCHPKHPVSTALKIEKAAEHGGRRKDITRATPVLTLSHHPHRHPVVTSVGLTGT